MAGVAEERWLPVPGYEDAYEVSDRGRVRSLERRALCRGGATRRVTERILRPVPRTGTRFSQVTLSCDGRRRRVYVHRLAAEAFGASVRGVTCAHMWTVVFKRPDGGDQVTHMKSSEAAARQDFAERVQEAPDKGYLYVWLVRDDVRVQTWPS